MDASNVSNQTPASDEELPRLAPDHSEVESAGDMEAVLPIDGQELLPVVGLGGSAGSIGPLREFFSRMPPDTGMGFVVILHLSPEHESTLAMLLGNFTTMTVVQVTESVKIEPNCVYVIPPGKQLSMDDGHLRVLDLERDRGRRVVVDLLLRTLADTHGPRAMAVILSGADGDGAIGIKRIKERGGPDDRPGTRRSRTRGDAPLGDRHRNGRLGAAGRRNACALGGIPGQRRPVAPAGRKPPLRSACPLRRAMKPPCGKSSPFCACAPAVILPFTSGGPSCGASHAACRSTACKTCPNTWLSCARIPAEVGALLQDLLISVTNFFRDRESFRELEQELPKLFKDRKMDDQIRVWVAGCATARRRIRLP